MTGHLLTTTAKPATCRRCGAVVLTGHAEGQPTACDTDPLDLAAELTALIAGLATYDLTGTTRQELVYRDHFRILHRRWPVLVQHGCTATGLAVRLDDPAEAWRKKRKPPPERPGQMQLPPAADTPPF